MILAENLKEVKEKIAAAAARAGRDASDIVLVAVSKKKPLEDIETLLAEGQMDYGENYVQELCEKYEHVSRPVRWHMIGHLQTNKVKQIIDKVVLIHSVDSLHLAKQIEKEAAKKDLVCDVLVQINIGQEESKFGIDLAGAEDLICQISQFPHVHVAGLMASAPFVDDPEKNRCYFRILHELFIDIQRKNIDNVDMKILSMGMTNDYEIAVEEGATMVRVGTAIFGARIYS